MAGRMTKHDAFGAVWRREVRERLDLFRNAGYILAPAGAAPAETPAESILAIADEARAQMRGPHA